MEGHPSPTVQLYARLLYQVFSDDHQAVAVVHVHAARVIHDGSGERNQAKQKDLSGWVRVNHFASC